MARRRIEDAERIFDRLFLARIRKANSPAPCRVCGRQVGARFCRGCANAIDRDLKAMGKTRADTDALTESIRFRKACLLITALGGEGPGVPRTNLLKSEDGDMALTVAQVKEMQEKVLGLTVAQVERTHQFAAGNLSVESLDVANKASNAHSNAVAVTMRHKLIDADADS